MKKIAIIGGGAAGLSCAVMSARKGYSVTLLERGARLGSKLSATGNGQGNVTNLDMSASRYFSDDPLRVSDVIARFGAQDAIGFLESMGGIFLPDGRGRVYPAGRQASAVTDLFRRETERLGVRVMLGARVTSLSRRKRFELSGDGFSEEADAVVLAAGGKAAANFGTDGTAYALAQSFGHTVAPLSPALVQLRCDRESVRGLKGIRTEAVLRVLRGGKELCRYRGDVLFTDAGVSGDAVFRASSYAEKGDKLLVDLLPDVSEARLRAAIGEARGEDCLLCLVNNGLGRMLYRKADGKEGLISLLKSYPLTVEGKLGFERAQVTRGGIPLKETDGNLMSLKRSGLYFAGEILNADGECGGYNLHWAFASAHCVAEGI